MNLQVKYRVLSEPAEVWWAGFRSDTYALQQQGWQIAAEEDVAYNRLRLLLHHRTIKLYALTDLVDYEFRRSYYQAGPGPRLLFNVVAAAPEMRVAQLPAVDFAAFREIDAKPQVLHEPVIKSIEDFRIFATPLARTEEIIVDPQTVGEMLDKIRKLQAPEQERLRAKQRLAEGRRAHEEGFGPRQTFHAQIISLDEHRLAA